MTMQCPCTIDACKKHQGNGTQESCLTSLIKSFHAALHVAVHNAAIGKALLLGILNQESAVVGHADACLFDASGAVNKHTCLIRDFE